MVVSCQILFDNNAEGTYFAGQTVSGRIVLTADKPKEVKAIAIKVQGFAQTNWEKSSDGCTYGRITCTGNEDYIGSITYLLGSDENQSLTIDTGLYSYTFSCHIPTNCPSSFEGTKGHIRYMVRVVLVRPWKYDQTYTKGFTVLKMLDLNYESPLLKMSANSDVERAFCFWPCKTEPLKVYATLPQSGYVPGQSVPLAVIVRNDSRIPVMEICAKLVMLIHYYSQTPIESTISERIVLSTFSTAYIQPHRRKLLNYELPVPATPPTCFDLCRLIQLAYQIEVEIQMPGLHPNQLICVPVTIGNVPLLQLAAIMQQPKSAANSLQRSASSTLQRSTSTASVKTQSDFMVVTDNFINPWEAIDSLPPPTFEEANHTARAKINADVPHDFGECDFAPRYPVFCVPNPTATSDVGAAL